MDGIDGGDGLIRVSLSIIDLHRQGLVEEEVVKLLSRWSLFRVEVLTTSSY